MEKGYRDRFGGPNSVLKAAPSSRPEVLQAQLRGLLVVAWETSVSE